LVEIDTLELGPLGTNCYILYDKESGEAVVIDPADDAERIWQGIVGKGLELKRILLTHAHFDHIGGVAELKEKSGADICIHSDDAQMLINPERNFSLYTGRIVRCPEANIFIDDGDSFMIGGFTIKMVHTPGHTPGGMSFLGDGFVIVGDTLFRGSIGRTDLPGSSFELLIDSIKKKLMILDDEVRVLPGHGPETTIGQEREENPFLA